MDPATPSKNINPRLYKDTLELAKLYNTSLTFRNSFKRLLEIPRVTYKGRPLKIYVRVIVDSVDELSKKTYTEYSKYKRQLSFTPEQTQEILKNFYQDKRYFPAFERKVESEEHPVSDQDHQELTIIEQEQDEEKKRQAYDRYIERGVQEEETTTNLPKQAQRQVQEELGQQVKSLRSKAQVQASRFLNKGLSGLGKFGGGMLRGAGRLLSKGSSAAAGAAARGIAALIAASGPVGWVVIAAVLIAILLPVFLLIFSQLFQEPSSLFPPFTQTHTYSSGGSGCLDTSTNISQCKYLNPSINLFDTVIAQTDIDAYAVKYKDIFLRSGQGDLAEFNKRVDYIVTTSKKAGLNPAIFLGYWKSESLFSTVGTRDMGCVGDNFYEQVDCALGVKAFSNPAKNPVANCTKSKDENSTACLALKSIRASLDKDHPVKYPLSTFDDFAESYGPYAHLTGGLPTNCSHTYNTLIDVSKELNMCKPSSGTPLAAVSCPIPGGVIGCASYGPKESWDGFSGVCRPDNRGIGGHCNVNYIKSVGICTTPFDKNGNLIRTAKSIDVSANSKAGDPVYLPTIGGKSLKWRYMGVVSAGSDFGWIRLFKSIDEGDGEWSLHFVHANLSSPALSIGDIIESGQVGATILYPWIPGDSWPHIHVTVGLNVGDSPSDLKDYSPNWKFADRDLGMCTNKP